MQDFSNNTYFDYETYFAKENEKKALKRTALAIGLSIIVYFVSSLIIGSLIAAPTSYLLGLATTVEIYDIIYECYIAVSYILPLALAILPIAFIVRIPRRVAIPMRRTPGGIAVTNIMFGIGCSTIGVTVASVLLSVFAMLGFEYNVPDQPVPQTAVGIAMYLVIISVFPAILEEILFRGFILQSLRRFGDLFAVLVSALIFALYHGNFAQFPNALILGFVIAFITVRTGSLVTGMVLHFINNFCVTALDIFVISNADEITAELISLAYLGVCFFIGVIGTIILVLKEPKFFTLKKPDPLLTKGERAKAFFLQPVSLIGMLLMLAFCFTFFAI